MRTKLAVAILALSSLLGLAVNHTQALDPSSASNITVRPFLQDVRINPGELTKQFDISISNDSKFTQVFHLSTIDFGSLNETGGLAFEGANVKKVSGKYGLSKWLSLERNDIELGPNQQTTVNVTINNNSDLAPGAHYAAIITTASKPIAAVGQLTITPKVSSLIFATKIGGEFYDMHLNSMSHNGSLWNLPTIVSLRLQSTGNTYIVPRGVVSLKQGDKVLSRGVINAQSSIVLPATIRSFDVALTQLANAKSGILYTDYTVQIDYRYDGLSNFAAQSHSYKILNKVTLIGIAILIILVLISAKIVKNPKLISRAKKILRLKT